MDNILNLRKKDATGYIDKLANMLYTDNNIKYAKDPHTDILTAATKTNKLGYVTNVVIGTQEIQNAKIGLLKTNKVKIDDTNFVKVISNIQHEYAHCLQYNSLYRQSDLSEKEKNQLIQRIACIGSRGYYKDDGINYYINAEEIQAEHYAINETYAYLCDTFPNVSNAYHEQLLVAVVNDKMLHATYFVKQNEPFTALEKINQAFDKAYDDSFTKERNFVYKHYLENDEIKQYLSNPEHKEAEIAYIHTKTPLEQDKCLAAIFLKMHPEWLDIYPVLKTMDLSYKTQITKRAAPYMVNLYAKQTTKIEAKGKQPPQNNKPIYDLPCYDDEEIEELPYDDFSL